MKSLKMLMMAALTILTISVFAQNDASNKTKAPRHRAQKVKYSCPMHTDVTSYKPGKCSKCGMDLVKSKKEQMKIDITKTYTCPTHSDEVLDKPGKCPQCGTTLQPTSKEQMKMQAVKLYTCPMHPDEAGKNPGKCPKCGMDMQVKN